MRSAKDDQRKQKEHAGRVVDAVPIKRAHSRKLRHLEADDENNGKKEKAYLRHPDAVMDTIERESEYERDDETQWRHPDVGIVPAAVERAL